ncbi:uncharacterized protein LOC143459255 isoform X2 [Clavelina lepadiformis]|uniref:Uncharacterized protein n=1 Tax=Clavelina lepadiformis TaxID=159417 RepID=A0ABP0GC73_CLALP
MDTKEDYSGILTLMAIHQLAPLVSDVQDISLNGEESNEDMNIDNNVEIEATSTERSLGLQSDLRTASNLTFNPSECSLETQYCLGVTANFANILVSHFVSVIATSRSEEAKKICNELLSIVQKTTDITADDLLILARKMQDEKKLIESLLFYQLSWKCLDHNDSTKVINRALKILSAFKGIIEETVDTGLVSKSLTKLYLIPQMASIRCAITDLDGLDKTKKCVAEALCLDRLGSCQRLAGDTNASKASFLEAIGLMDRELSEKAEKHEVYSKHLHSLGETYLTQGETNEAIKVFLRAIAAMKKADYDTERERKKNINVTERCIIRAQNQPIALLSRLFY